jgi:hypothetical protein
MEGDEKKRPVAGQEMMNKKLNYSQTTCNKYSSLMSNKAGTKTN